MSTVAVSAARLASRTIVSTNFARCSRPQYLRLRAQQQSFRPAIRSFAASARAWEKKYTEDHEWVELSEDGSIGTIGISEYAAKALGDVVFVELPTTDLEVSQGEPIGAVESVKSASDIMSPLSGVIVEANNVLETTPATINKSPEGEGWFARIKIEDSSELDSLMDASAYKAFTTEADSKH